MRKTWPTLVAMSALLLAPLGLHAPLRAQTAPAVTNARVIVKFKADSPLLRRQALSVSASSERAASLSSRVGLPLSAGAAVSERTQVVTASGIGSAELAQRLAAQSDVEYAVPDQRRHRFAPPNDPRYTTVSIGNGGPVSGQWYLRAPTSTVRSAINVEPAWDITTGSTSVVVAVLDTGIRFDHNDLLAVGSGGNLLLGYDMVSADPSGPAFFTANDGDGRDANASDPGDAIAAGECGSGLPTVAESSSWHGTQTAGLIGALTDNSVGMASVGRTVRVLPVRVLGRCGGYDSDIIAGMRWAAGLSVPGVPANPNPAKVINMSLGGEGACSTLYTSEIPAITAAGVVIIASAGNSAGHAVSSPANCPGVIAVTGLRHVGTKVGFADVGTEVAIAAPGGNCVNETGACLYPILTTSNAGTAAPAPNSSVYSDSFNISVGTSFSAPLVAGTVGLMFSAQPGMSVAEVRAALQASSRHFPTSGSDSSGVLACRAPNGIDQLECYCTTATCGAGMLDAGAAVAAANVGVQARVTLSDDTPQAPQVIALSAASSFALGARTLDTYQWTLVNGGGIVTAFTSNSGATATLTPSAAGQIVVSLTVTDSSGAQSTVTRTIDVAAAPAPTPPLATGGGGGGGGGLGLVWLTGLAMGVIALQMQRNRRQRTQSQRVPVRGRSSRD